MEKRKFMWAWMLLILMWLVLIGLVGVKFDSDWLVFGVGVLVLILIFIAAAMASIEFLRYFEAWPFTPQ